MNNSRKTIIVKGMLFLVVMFLGACANNKSSFSPTSESQAPARTVALATAPTPENASTTTPVQESGNNQPELEFDP